MAFRSVQSIVRCERNVVVGMAVENEGLSVVEGLAGLGLKPEYRSDADDLVRDFYVPCLERSTLYRRGESGRSAPKRACQPVAASGRGHPSLGNNGRCGLASNRGAASRRLSDLVV